MKALELYIFLGALGRGGGEIICIHIHTTDLNTLLQHGEAGLDGNDQTLTPGQKIRTSKKKVQQLESQVAQLKNSR